MTREARHLRCPANVLGWIPWYFDGSLTDRERGAVEAHAAECSDCRAELDLIAGGPFEIDVELPDPDRAFAQIMARINDAMEDAEDVEEPSAQIFPIGSRAKDPDRDRSTQLARIAAWARTNSTSDEDADRGRVIRGPWLNSPMWAAAAAVVLVSLGALAGATLFGAGGSGASNSNASSIAVDTYDLASSAVVPVSLGTAMINVVFRESATVAEIAGALRGVGAEIVAGPTNLGVFQVRLASESIGSADAQGPSGLDVEVVLARLKAPTDGVAIFAEVAR